MSADVIYFRIERIVRSGAECFLCALEDETERKYIDAYLSELVMDSKAREIVQDLQKQRKRAKEVFRQTIECPACTHLANMMEIYDRKIVELLCSRNEEFLKLFKNSKGLCTPHFALLLKMIQDTMHSQIQEIIRTMIDVEEKNFIQLKSEISEYIRRQSYEFSDKDRKAVEDVLLKSVQKIVGRRGIKHDNI